MYATVDVKKKEKNHPIPSKPVPLDATYSMVTASECQATYAAVDMSKKRKDKNKPKEKETALSDTTAVSMCDGVERDVGKKQNKDIAETFDANYSTLDLHTATKTTPDSPPQPVVLKI